ncbi:MAG: leucine-rich repeat protein [Prevotella sp.]|nr:leucine-rich repeat protein [Prevotella sp.]
MKKLLFSFALMLIALSASAVDFETGMCKYRTTGTDEETGLKTVTCIGLSTSYANSTEVGVPSTVYYNNEYYLVTSIGNAAFNSNKNLTKVTLSKGLQSIASAAFGACSNLKEVYLPSTLTYVGNNAFLNCGNSLVIYAAWIDKVPTFGTTVFSNATSYSTTVTRIYVPTRAGRDIVNADATLNALSATVTVDPSKANDGQLTLNSKNFFYVVTKMPTSSADGVLSMVGADCADIRTTNLGPLFLAQNSSGRNMYFALTAIAPYAFYGNTSVMSVANVSNTAIGTYAFYGCTNLTQANIRSGSIGSYAFYNCSALTSLVLGNESDSYNLTVGDYAFYNTAIETVTVNKNVTQLGSSMYSSYRAFTGTKLKTITVSSGNTIYSSYNGMLYDKNQVQLYYVPQYTTYTQLWRNVFAPNMKTITYGAMYSNKTLTLVDIPYGVTSIGAYACYSVSTLTDIRIPSSVTSIGDYAFSGLSSSAVFSCAWLSTSNLPSFGTSPFGTMTGFTMKLPTQQAVESMPGNNAVLQACSPKYAVAPITSSDVVSTSTSSDPQTRCYVVTQAPTTTTTGKMALVGANVYNNNGTLYMGDTEMEYDSKIALRGSAVIQRIYCDEIAPMAFINDTYVKKVLLSFSVGKPGIECISGSAFEGCKNLTNVAIQSPAAIKSMAFYNCPALNTIQIYDTTNSITEIGDQAFAEPDGTEKPVTEMTIPQSCTLIQPTAFFNTKISKFTVSGLNRYYSGYYGMIFNYAQNTLVVVPPYKATTDYSPDTPSIFPDNMTTIGDYAFCRNKKVQYIEVPYGVSKIGAYAFSNIPTLKYVNFPSSMTTYGNKILYNSSGLTAIGVNTLTQTHVTASDAMLAGLPDDFTVYCGSFDPYPYASNITHWKRMKKIMFGAYDFSSVSEDYLNVVYYTVPDPSKAEARIVRSYYKGVQQKHEGALKIASTVGWHGRTYSVTSLGSKAFRENTNLTSVTLPNTITEFEGTNTTVINSTGGDQFYDCTNLKKLNIPVGIKSIPMSCFEQCGLETIRVPYGVEEIGVCAFSGCYGLKSLYLPSSVKKIVSPIIMFDYNNLGELTRDITFEEVYVNFDLDLLHGDGFLCNAVSKFNNSFYVPYEDYINDERLAPLKAMYPKATFKPGAYDFIISDTDLGTAWCTVTKAATGTTQQAAGEAKYVRGPSPTQTLQAIIGSVKQESPWVSGAYPSEQRYYNVNTMAVGAFSDCVNLTKVTLNTELDSIPDYAFKNTTQLYSFPFDDANCQNLKYIGIESFNNSGLSGDVTLSLDFSMYGGESVGKIEKDAFANCIRLNSLTLVNNNADYYSRFISFPGPFYGGNMRDDFRCYVPSLSYAWYVGKFIEKAGEKYAGMLYPYVRSKEKFIEVAFPTMPFGDNPNVRLANIVKEGGKIYRAGCKLSNPVDANGYVDLVEVKIDPAYDYEYSGAYGDEGYILEVTPGKIYKLERQPLSNLYGEGNVTNSYNLLRAGESFDSDGKYTVKVVYGNKNEYLWGYIWTSSAQSIIYEKANDLGNMAKGAYISFDGVSQTSPTPANISQIRFRIPVTYDLNGDGKVSTADIQVIINEMKKPAASQNMSYDLNGDGKISTADIQVIINEMKK